MKKIFSILFTLVLVVSLGLVTVAPVLADISPGWTDIVQLDAGSIHTEGLKSDGTVVAVGWNGSGYDPLETEPQEVTETVTNSTVDARAEADTEVDVDGTATVTVFPYDENPGGVPPVASPDQPDWESLGKYIDVYVPDTSEATELEIRLYYTDDEAKDFDEESLRLFWWNGTNWVACSDSGVNTASNYMWAKIRNNTTPSLSDLQGTPWGGYGHPKEKKGICFIATAAYGTDTAKEIDILREFRDEFLLPDRLGAKLVSLYSQVSPPIAGLISEHEVLRITVRVGFVDPIVAILNWSHDLWSARGSQCRVGWRKIELTPLLHY